MVGRRTIVEDVLPVVGKDDTARSTARNPYIHPTITDSNSTNGLTNPTHEKLVLNKTNRAVRHVTPTRGDIMRDQPESTSRKCNVT